MLEENDLEIIGKILNSWAGLASHFIGECYDFSRPYIENDSEFWSPQVRFISSQLFIDCHLTSESVLLLLTSVKEWDADLIARSVIEGTMKYVYMITGTDEEKIQKTDEYWNILPSFSNIKMSERLKKFLEVVANPDSSEWRAFKDLILTDEQVELIRKDYPKSKRQELEQRWSFSGITKQFANSNDSNLINCSVWAHGYGMSSHLLHKDGLGVSIIRERNLRNSDREGSIKLAHAARIISDICILSELRIRYLLKVHQEEPRILIDLRKKYDLLFSETKRATESFNSAEYPD